MGGAVLLLLLSEGPLFGGTPPPPVTSVSAGTPIQFDMEGLLFPGQMDVSPAWAFALSPLPLPLGPDTIDLQATSTDSSVNIEGTIE